MRFHKGFLYGLFVALILIALPALCQTITSGDVSGSVKDTTGAVVPGATVTIRSDTGDTRTQTTDSSGTFRFTFLKPGSYTVSAVAAGLKTDVTKLAVDVGQVATVDLIAKVQATQEVIEVMASGAIVETENANLSTTYTATQMQELPAGGGDMTTIAFTSPGIVMSTGGGYGNFSSHGMPGVSNLFTINGNDYNDAYLNLNNSGASNNLLGVNEVQEAAVVQNAYSVQYGREAGAQINYITKSGSNGFHGDLVWNWNGDRLNANDFFSNTDGLARPKAISNQWAADVGGPIRKDKTFFYADTEGLYYTLPSAGIVTIPTPQLQSYILSNVSAGSLPLYQNAFKIWNSAPGVSGAVPITNGSGLLQDANGNLGCGVTGFAGTAAPGGGTFGTTVPCGESWAHSGSNTNKEHLYTFRVDHSITDKQKIYVRLKHDDGFQPTETNLVSSTFNEQSIQPEWDGAVNYTYVISPTVVNSFIGSVLWYSAYFGPANVSASQQLFPYQLNITDGGANGATGFYQMGSTWNNFPQGRDVGQAQLIDDLSITRGRHTIKFGENFRRNRVSDFGLLVGTTGQYSFGSLTDFANGVTDPNYGSAYSQTFTSITTAHIRLYNIGVYAQDEWAATNNLKVTFGLRLDRTGNPLCTDKCFSRLTAPFSSSSFQKGADIPYDQSIDSGLSNAYYNVDSVVPQPRLGVVWSPRGSGSNAMVIRGGFGLFADLAPAFLVSNLFHNAPYPYGTYVNGGQEVGLASDPSSAAAQAQNEFNAFKTGFFNGQTLAQLTSAVPGFGPFSYSSIDQHFSTPMYAEWSFEIEQPIGQKNVLVATYSGNHGYNLLAQNGFANAAALGGSFNGLPSVQPDPRFLAVTELTNQGISNYDGLTFQYRRAFSHGFQGQINYTWSHALDDVSNGGSGLQFGYNSELFSTLTNPNIRANYGNSDYDIRHNVTSDFVWDTPWKFHNRGLNYLLGDWTLSSKFYVRTGMPESLTDTLLTNVFEGTLNVGSTFGGLLPTSVSNVPEHCGNAAVNGATPCLSQSMFLPAGTEPGFSNLGRNTLFGPGYFNIDTSLYKNIAITERIRFTIGASAYNLLNHAHFADPYPNVASGAVGGIYGTVEEPTSAYGAFQGSVVTGRVMVLTAKFRF